MSKYFFTVTGMVSENGHFCFSCVQTFISCLSLSGDVESVSYSNVKKCFVLVTKLNNIRKTENLIRKALKTTSESLNKTFTFGKILS